MPASMQNRLHAVAFIVILVLIESIGFGIILPVMPQLIMGLGDVSLSSASAIGGYLMFTYAAVQFFAAPILGAAFGGGFILGPVIGGLLGEFGELQGALSSLSSITAILGPLLMTQLFAWYSAPDAAFYFLGMSFIAAAALTALCLLVFVVTVKGLGTAQAEPVR